MGDHLKPIAGALMLCVAFLVPSGAAAAPKSVVAEIGAVSGDNGVAGGLFNMPRAGAVNRTGAGLPAGSAGSLYVVDALNNRVQQFGPGGEFVRAWGAGVLSGGAAFEVCAVAADCRRGLNSSGAGGLAGQAPTDAAAGIAVDQSTGSVYVSDQGNSRIDVFSASGNFQGAFGYGVKANAPAEELQFCTIATGCKAGTGNPFALSKGGQFGDLIGGVAVAPPEAPNAGHVFVANREHNRIDELEPVVEGGVVTGVSFVRSYGWNVVIGGGGGFEVCEVATSCKAGAGGLGLGQFGSESVMDVDVDSEGNVFALDPVNRRVQKFSPAAAPMTANFGDESPAQPLTAAFGTGGLLNIAVDPSSTPNHLLVSGKRMSAGDRIAVLELDADGSAVDLHGAGLTANEGTGLAVAPRSLAGYIYVSTYPPSSASTNVNRVYVLGDDGKPTIMPATGLTATSAVLHGEVVSNGAQTSYHFEYSADGGKTWARFPASDVGVAPVPGSEAVEETVSGLTPNSDYLYRLVSLRPTGGFRFVSETEAFTTLAAPPAAPDVSAVDVDDTSARLVGQVDPHGLATGYVFSYGTTPALGSATPLASAGAGYGIALVSQVVAGLQPATTYHFQLVATNAAGSTPSPVRTFTTRAVPLPAPDGRAYEMVTPVDKNFGPADGFGTGQSISAEDGEGAAFCTTAQFGEDPPTQTRPCVSYVSRRGEEGWHTRGVWGPFCPHDINDPVPRQANVEVLGLSPNVDRTVFRLPESPNCPIPPLDPAAPLGINLYRGDVRSAATAHSLLTPVSEPPIALGQTNGSYGAASATFENIAFTSTAAHAPGATGTNVKVFEWVAPGTRRLVSLDTGNVPFATSSAVPWAEEGGTADGLNVVAADGARIFFQNPAGTNGKCLLFGACNLYVREDGAATYMVSEPECTSVCVKTKADSFEWATPSGHKAFFLTENKLVDSDDSVGLGKDLYMFTKGPDPAGEPNNLTLLSRDAEPADGANPKVLGMLGLADDGDAVYFAAEGQIVAGASTASGPKLYRWRWNGGAPTIEFLALLAAGQRDAQNWNAQQTGGLPSESPGARLVNPAGSVLLIQTVRPLDPVADRDADLDVYRWSESGGWLCVSCQGLGVPSAGESSYDAKKVGNGLVSKRLGMNVRLVMTDDGQRVYFGSSDPLVAVDVNGVEDVYEWHHGRVNLISTGTDPRRSTLIGASSTGRDVFFFTRQKLVGWDSDVVSDIYDARIGGGFPEPPADLSGCRGDACQGSVAPLPPTPQVGSTHSSAGNLRNRSARPKPCRRKVSKEHRKRGKSAPKAKRSVAKAPRKRAASKRTAKRCQKGGRR